MLSEGINHKTYWKQVESFVILALDLFILTLKQLLPGKDSDNRGDSSMTFMDESDKSFSSKRLVG
ncbi:MAG TPA: hypothetical protein DCR17_06775 [Verrucomicrobiales bacterium]|nr:hypothetical protein [Pedosphaera sp.]HAO66373.1 hypothetical protein [Verrucomicrobiales bacterium]HCP37535.1 hypothetical protein [Verrucomicrobiales bacterium]HCZ04861.1 hypothetical protein [Verrucomicrobiales bacterium]|tara:strand:- start:344 stop:538 length:195 start_codon:yes stop_codon:yes gene_type:complete